MFTKTLVLLLVIVTVVSVGVAEDQTNDPHFIHRKRVESLAFDSESKHLAAACLNRIGMWDASTGKHLVWYRHSIRDPAIRIPSIVFSPNGQYLFAAGNDGRVTMWDRSTGHRCRTISEPWIIHCPSEPIPLNPISEDGLYALYSLMPASSVGFSSMALSPDGKLIAAGLFDRTAHLWNADTGEHIAEFGTSLAKKQHYQLDEIVTDRERRQSWKVAFGKTDASGDGQKQVEQVSIWTLPQFERRAVSGISFYPDGESLILYDGQIRVHNAKNGEQVFAIEDCSGFALSSDGNLIATFNSNTVKTCLFDGHTGELRAVLAYGRNANGLFLFSHDARQLVTGGKDNFIRVWNVNDRSVIHKFPSERPTTPVRCAAISPNGKLLAAFWDDVGIRLWNLESGEEQFRTPNKGEHCAENPSPTGNQ